MSRHLKSQNSSGALQRINEELRAQLEDAQEVIEAIRAGRVDALAIEGPDGEKIYTLEDADHPYRTFVEAMNEGAMTVSTDGTILYCNRILADLIGLPLEHTLGTQLNQFVWPSDFPLWETLIRDAQGSRRRVELSLRHADGTGIPVQMSARSMTPTSGVCVVVTDLRGQKLQEKLRESEERLRLALEAGQMGAWDVDLRSHTISWDDREYSLLGFEGASVEPSAQQFYRCVHPDDLSEVKRRVDDAFATGRLEQEFRVVHPDGQVRWLAARGHVLHDDQGLPVRIVGINFDVTDRRGVEEQLRYFAVELERLVDERTQELLQSQTRLRALATELNLAEQRERKRLAGELHDYLAQLLVLCRLKLGQARRAGLPSKAEETIKETEEVLSQALNYSRTLMAELSPPVLQAQGLPAGLKWLGEQMQRHGLQVRVEVGDVSCVSLPEDCAVLLFQSVRELLMNVLKHAESKIVTVRLQQGERRLSLEVQDDGIGFDLAASSTSGTSTTAMSCKFGLFSIRERMKALGGWFDLQSAPGEGTTATLVLPLAGPVAAETVDARHGSSEVEEGSKKLVGKGRPNFNSEFNQPSAVSSEFKIAVLRTPHAPRPIRILLVDDHAMVRQGLRSVLDSYADIEVVGEAWNGEEAVAVAETLRPDVVLMDINMPKMDGIEATALIKMRYPNMIVIGLSVQAGDATAEAIRNAGAAMLLTKEAAVDELYKSIRVVLDNGQHARQVP